MKICSTCKEQKPFSEFSPNKKGKNGLHACCKKCKVEKSLQWNKKNRSRHNLHSYRNHFKSRYGLSLEQLEQMKKSQDSKCAICNEIKKLSVDHSHSSGKVRGLLCHRCNSAIGYFKENVVSLKNAISYLRSHASS